MKKCALQIVSFCLAMFIAYICGGLNIYHYCCDACKEHGHDIFQTISCEEVHASHHCSDDDCHHSHHNHTRIIENQDGVTIDEIKGTYRDVAKMKAPELLHIAQAKCYAYIYCTQKNLSEIRVRMSYCNIETENICYFYEDYTFSQLEKWFLSLIVEYRKWSDYNWSWRKCRQKTIENLQFPFSYREGQKELAAYVYQTIYHKKKLSSIL